MEKPASERVRQLDSWSGPTYQDSISRDDQRIPGVLLETYPADLGSAPIKASRYTDPEFFKKEVDAVFLRTWQYAVLEAEIPQPGDTHVYELCGHSVLIARQRDGSIKAMRNVCLHRGRRLVDMGGCATRYRCPYHGFTWNIDGSFVPNAVLWDFPEIDPDNFALREIRAETWAGLVFINFDANARPLLEMLGPLVRHFEQWPLDRFYKSAHVGKIMPANWKAVCEAFIENLHVGATHPQLSPYTTDGNSQVDLLSDHVGRAIASIGHASGLVYAGKSLEQQQIADRLLANGSRAGKVSPAPLARGKTARREMCDLARKALGELTGWDYSQVADAELLDGISYDFFPNFQPWGGMATRLCYRIRPDGVNHERTLMEIMLFSPRPKEGPPPPAQFRMLGEDEPWSAGTELLHYGPIIDQDYANMSAIQKGLRDLGNGEIHFGRYSELRCRNLHRMVDVYIERYEREKQPGKGDLE